MPSLSLTPANTLPADADRAALAGRVWRPDLAGPSVVKLQGDRVIDVTATFPTMRDLCETADPAVALRATDGENLGSLADLLANSSAASRNDGKPWLLAPVDLQAVKAAGVTFAVSMLERVIEEKARGNPAAAAAIRTEIGKLIGDDLSKLKPGSPEAMKLKEVLIAQNSWSQYLEVGIGPDAEIFTKAPPMSAVGTGADAGLHPGSSWNNPEPEIVIIVASDGRIVGASLGNDVNLRDFEGRSALLLGKAKDNNAAAAIGPFIRFFNGRLLARPCAQDDGEPDRRGRGRLHAGRLVLDRHDQPRPGRPRRADDRPRTTSIRTGRCSISAPCSRRSRIATRRAAASPINTATSSPSRRPSSARWSTGCGAPTSASPGASAPRI